MENGLIRLNLGCGNRHLPGFVNVDFADNWCKKKPEIECDVRKLPLPDDYADEVHAYHVFEHFYRYEAEDVLTEWVRVLKPGGKLVLELPCLDKILGIFDWADKNKQPYPINLTMWGLFGSPKYKDPTMCHRWCYSVAELTGMMKHAGLEVTEHEPITHQPIRDMHLEGVK